MGRARTPASPDWLVVSLKALGDFLIAFRSLRAVEPGPAAAVRILAAEHLRDFIAALGATDNVRFLTSGPDYPSAWDVRRQGAGPALRSLLMLRRQFNTLPPDCRLLFDQLGWRERFLGFPHRCRRLRPAPNVYQAFAQTLSDIGMTCKAASGGLDTARVQGGTARIYAASRIAAKTIPGPVVARVAGQLVAAGMNCEVIALGDEQLEVPASVPARRIERSFKALIQSIGASSLVISADSLPGHLADYLGIPVHVISPRANEYWLPLSCFVEGSWSIFEDEGALPLWLSKLALERPFPLRHT